MDTRRIEGRGSQTVMDTAKRKAKNNDRFTINPGDQFKRQIDLNKPKNSEKTSYKNSEETLKNNLKDIIAKTTEFGHRGVEALVLHPFSPHPLGQDRKIEDAQLTQSDHETRLINHGLAFQFQDGLEKAASFHFADSEAFQKAKDLALGSIMKIDNVQRKKNYLLKTLGSDTTLDANNRIAEVKQCLATIKELKTDTNMISDSQTLKLRIAKLKIKEYADNTNKRATVIKNKLIHISETKQLIETLIEQVGTSKTLDTLKSNLKQYEDNLQKVIALEENFSKKLKDIFDTNNTHKIFDAIKNLEATDVENLIEAENKARDVLLTFNQNYTDEQKSHIKRAFEHYTDSLQKETQGKLAESREQIEKIEQEFNDAVQKDEQAATVAHLILDRDAGRVTINGVWVDVREIDGFDFSKEGQTTVNWRPDIPLIQIKTHDSTKPGKTEKAIDDKALQELYAKRHAKVEKLSEWGKCTFEIPGNTFNTFTTASDSPDSKVPARRIAILTMECKRDLTTNSAIVQDHDPEIIDVAKLEIEPTIDKENCRVVKNRKDEDVHVGIIKKTYKFKSNEGKDITITIKEETKLDTRDRDGGKEQVMTKVVMQTQECMFRENWKEVKTISRRRSEFIQTIDKNDVISKQEKKTYTEYLNSQNQVAKSVYEIPADTLKSITIDTITKNDKMLAEQMTAITTKTLPDSPIIYHGEVKTNPEIDLRQTDRINLIARKFFFRNGRAMNLDPAKPKRPDWTETKDIRNYVPNCGLIFQLAGPTRSLFVPVKYAGSDILFTQQDKAKEDDLISMVKANQMKLLHHLKESILLASDNLNSDRFNPEILKKAFNTAGMHDNEINRQIALNKEILMNPPENRNDLAQLIKSREAGQGDVVIPKTADGNSEQTREMTEAGKNFRKVLVDAITDKRNEGELLTQIAVDQQGLEKLVAYDEYHHKLSLVDDKTLDLINVGKQIFGTDDGKQMLGLTEDDTKVFDLTNPVTATRIREISATVKEKIPELTTKIDTDLETLTNKIQRKISDFQGKLKDEITFVENTKIDIEDKIGSPRQIFENISNSIKIIEEGINGAKWFMGNNAQQKKQPLGGETKNKTFTRSNTMPRIPSEKMMQLTAGDDGEQTKISDTTHEDIKKLLDEHTEKMVQIETKVRDIANTFGSVTQENISRAAKSHYKEIKQFEKQLDKLKTDMDKAANNIIIIQETATDDKHGKADHTIIFEEAATDDKGKKSANTVTFEAATNDNHEKADNNTIAIQNTATDDNFDKMAKDLIEINKTRLGTTYSIYTMIDDLTERGEKINDFIECVNKIKKLYQSFNSLKYDCNNKSKQLTNDQKELEVLAEYAKNPESEENRKKLTDALTQEGAKKLEELSQSTEPTKLLEETKKLIHEEHIKLLGEIIKVIESDNTQDLTKDLNDIKKRSKYIENGIKSIDDIHTYADQIADVTHLISNMKKIEDSIDNSSDLYAKNWLNLKRAKAAVDHNKFQSIEEEKVSTTISKETASHHKNWLIIREAIEDKGIKGAYSYIASLKEPTLSNINSPKGAREAFENSWIKYLRDITNQAHGDYTSIKVALPKVEYIRQCIDKNEKAIQNMISQGVPLEERQRQILDTMPDIDETFLITPSRPKVSKDALARTRSQQQDTHANFNPSILKHKSSEQLSEDARTLATEDLRRAMKTVEELITQEIADPTLREYFKKDAKDLVKIFMKYSHDYKKMEREIQNWWQKLPEMRKLQKWQFWMSVLAAAFNNTTAGVNFMNDSAGKANTKLVSSIVG